MSTSPYTLLIIDDFAADRELYRRSLLTDPKYTYRLLEAESLAQGRELCQRHQFDAVLLDYSLPDGDGLEFLVELSARYPNPPPVVMLTGQGSESIAVRAIKLGARDYISKRNLNIDLLQLTIQKVIENHRLQQQLQQVEERFRLSIDNMSDCVGLYSVIQDEAGQIIDFRFDYLNPAALASNRMNSDDIGKSVCEMFPAFRTSGLFEEYCQLVTTGQPLIIEDLVYEDIFAGEKIVKYYAIHASRLNNDDLMVSWRDLTIQKQAESQLQAANQQIIEIWESMTDAYVTLDRQWRFIYANQAATQVIFQLTNLTPEQFLGTSHWDVFPWLVGGDVEREYRRALRDRVAVDLEIVYEPTGSWFESHLYPSAEGLGIYFREITDRKQIEAERLTAIEERDRFFDLSLDLLAVGNFDGYLARINPAFERLLGFTEAEFLGRPYLEFVHPDDRAATLAAAQRLAQDERVVDFETRCLAQDGSDRWISWRATPYIQTGVWYAVGRDITEQQAVLRDRKREEAQLRQAEATIRQQLDEIETIYNNAPIGMCFVDTDLRYIRINAQLAQINGAAVSAHLGHTFREVLPELVDRVEPLYRQVIESGEAIIDLEVSGTNQAQPGVERYWLASFYPQTDAAGRVIGVNNVVHEITDRKRLELDRIAAEQERDRFFNLSIDLLVTMNFSGYFTRVNPAWERTLGFTAAELMERPFIEFIHPDDRAATLTAAQEVIAGELLTSFENRYLCKDGSYRWILWSAIPYPEQDVMYAIGHDITDRKQQEAALRESEQKFSAIFNQTFEFIGLLSIDGILREVNQTALAAIDVRLADVIDREFWDTRWWSHSPAAQSQIRAAIEQAAIGEFSRFQMQLPTPIDTVIDLDVSIKPIFDAAGNVTRLLAEGRDITPLKQAERALQESDRKFSAIFEQSFELMGIVSLDGVLLEVNQTALDSIVAQREDLVGKPFWEAPWWHTEQLQQQLQDSIARAANGEFSRYEVQFPSPSGVMLTTDFSLKPVFDETGSVVTIVAEAHDITDRQQALAALRARNQELDSFVYVVSHDLKAPLRAVANLSQWIEEDLEGSLSDANQQQMNLLRSRIERMSATIDGLLDYARIGRTEDSIEPVAVAELIAETLDSLAPPPTFRIAIAQKLPTLYTKRMLLSQVFTNLIGNAIKHHDRMDGTIHLGIAERKDFYEFAIADDGPGIDPANHDRVFRIFQAVNPQNRSDSTGIGLAIVKKIIEAEGGTIRLESQVGKGTTFYFTWPK